MVAWLTARGVDLTRVEIVRRPDGERALRARRALREGEEILRVPASCMITSEAAIASPIGRAIARSRVKLRGPHSRLAAYLIVERRAAASGWRPFIAAFPASLTHMPVNFGPAELGLLRGSFMPGRVRAYRAMIANDHELLVSSCSALRDVTLAEFTWAMMIVASRSYSVEEGRGQAMVPIVDMMNHDVDRETSGSFDDDTGAYVVRARVDCAEGQELRACYGYRCNSRLFMGYGFCQEDNPHNTAVLVVPDPSKGTRRFMVSPTREDAALVFSFLRRACATPAELDLLGQRRADRGRVAPIGSRNERAFLRTLAAAARDTLATFDTTIEQDDELLADPALSRTARACILMRRGEKRVLAAFIDLAHATIPFLRLPAADFRRAAAEHGARSTFSGNHLADLAWRAPLGKLSE